MEDKQIIELYFARNESAITETDKKYGAYCRAVAYRILEDRLDSEEIANDTYLRLWNSIPPENPQFLRAYLLKVLRNIAYDRLDKRNAVQRRSNMAVCLQELEDCLPSGFDMDAVADSMVIRDALNDYLYSLSRKDRFIFIRRYYCMDSCRAIAGMAGMTESAVSTRLGRLRQDLKDSLAQEGIYV